MENSDPLTFFSAYERALQLNGIDGADWPKFLASCLTKKANKILAGLTLDQCRNYAACKGAILTYFHLDAAAYFQRFRQARKQTDETFQMFRTRITDYYTYFIESKQIKTLEALKDAIVAEQILSVLPSDTKQFVLSKQSQSADDCCKVADLHLQMARTTGAPQFQGTAQNPSPPAGRKPMGEPGMHLRPKGPSRGVLIGLTVTKVTRPIRPNRMQ